MIGPAENVFHHIIAITRCIDIAHALDRLDALARPVGPLE